MDCDIDETSEEKLIYFVDDDEYKIYCDICAKFAIDRYYNNHPKPQTCGNKFYKRQRLFNTNAITWK